MHARVWQHPHDKAPRGTVRTILEIHLERSERLLMSDHLRREIRLVQISGFARSQRVEFLLMLQNERSRDRHIPAAFASGVSARRGPSAHPRQISGIICLPTGDFDFSPALSRMLHRTHPARRAEARSLYQTCSAWAPLLGFAGPRLGVSPIGDKDRIEYVPLPSTDGPSDHRPVAGALPSA